MADRSVAVELRLKAAAYLAGLSAAKKATRDFGAETLKATKANHANLQAVGRAGFLAGGAIAGGLFLAVKANTAFEKSLSGVRAVAGATAGEMNQLKDAAIEAGQATVFSASDAAQAEAELAKAGISVGNILGGALRGSLDLAAAGQLDLADAATIAAQSMKIFKLQGSDVAHVADVLAAGANKSAADVGQLGEALRQGGLGAAQTGAGLEETVGVLSAFADNALIGSDAGTSLKTMLASLTPQSDKAKAAMEQIGLAAYDSTGTFIGLEGVAGQLQKGLSGLSAEERNNALQTIFGNDAKRAASVLYEEGAAGIRDYTDAVNDQGAASRMAATQLDNLAGDLEQLKGSIETSLIRSGSSGNDSLRALTQAATGSVNAFGNLPTPILAAGFALGGVASAGLLTAGAVATMLPKIRDSREALRGLGAAGITADKGLGRAARAAGKASIALAVLTAAVEVFGANKGDMAAFADEVEAAAGPDTQAQITELTNRMEKLRKFSEGGWDVGFGGTRVFINEFGQGYSDAADKADALQERIKALKHQMKLAGIEEKAAADTAVDLGDGLGAVTPAARDAAVALKGYTDALSDTVAIDAFTATAELAKSFKDLNEELSGGGGAGAAEIQVAQLRLQAARERAAKDGATASERASVIAAETKLAALRSKGGGDRAVTNEDKIALGGFAREVKATSQAVLDQTDSQTKANRAMRDGRKQFVDLAEQAGYTAKQARRLADRLLEIPKRTDVTIDVDIDHGLAQIRRLQRALVKSGVSAALAAGIAGKVAAGGTGQASGGAIYGPGSGTSDSIPAMLSNGEFVINAAATARNRGLLEAINSGRQPANGGYANGGAVTVVKVPVAESTTYSSPMHIEHLHGGLAEADRQQRLQNLRNRQTRGRSMP